MAAPFTGFQFGTGAAATPATSSISFGAPASQGAGAAGAAASSAPAGGASTGFSFGFGAATSTPAASGAALTSQSTATPPASLAFGFSASAAQPATSASTGPAAAALTSGATAASSAAAQTSTVPSFGFGVAPATAASAPQTTQGAATSASQPATQATLSFGAPSAAAAGTTAAAAAGTAAGTAGTNAAATAAAAAPGTTPAQAQAEQQKQQQQVVTQPVPHISLVLKPPDGATSLTPASYSTRFEELHPESQKLLLSLEERVFACRAQSSAMAQQPSLQDSAHGGTLRKARENFEAHGARVRQRLNALGSAIEAEHSSLGSVLLATHRLQHLAEAAVSSFALLAHKYPQLQVVGVVPGMSGAFVLPQQQHLSSFLPDMVERFERQLAQYEYRLEELEKILLPLDRSSWGAAASLDASGTGAAAVLPSLLQNIHSFLIHVAAQMEPLHEAVEDAKAAFLAERRRRGDLSDPFRDAEKKERAHADRLRFEAAQSERAALPGPHSPFALPAGRAPALLSPINPALLAASGIMSPLNAAGAQGPLPTGASPAALPGTSGASGLVPGQPPPTPSPFFAAASSPALATPATAGLKFGASPAPSATPGLFGAPAATPGLFGASSSGAAGSSLFGTPGAPTPSLFGGASATPSLFGAASATPSLFGTPSTAASAPGAATTSLFGASSGAPTTTPLSFGSAALAGAAAATPSFGGPPPLTIPSATGLSTLGSSGNLNTPRPKPRAVRRR